MEKFLTNLENRLALLAKHINGRDLAALLVVSFVAVAVTAYTDALAGLVAGAGFSLVYAYFKADPL